MLSHLDTYLCYPTFRFPWYNTPCYTSFRSPDITSYPLHCNTLMWETQVPCGITHSRYPSGIAHLILGATVLETICEPLSTLYWELLIVTHDDHNYLVLSMMANSLQYIANFLTSSVSLAKLLNNSKLTRRWSCVPFSLH